MTDLSVTDLSAPGRVVVVTGGSRGIGRGIVEAFLARGAVVETCGRSAPAALISVEGREAAFTAVDVRDPAAVQAWVDGIVARHGGIDVLVNNAGGAPLVDFSDSSIRLLTKVLELNLTSAVIVTHAARDALREGSCVLSISSMSGARPSPGSAVYGAAKAGLDALTASLAAEWAPRVRVNALRCGHVDSDGGDEHFGDAASKARIAATIPSRRMATPADIGDVCLLLASPLARHVTGAVLDVDGGGEWPAFLMESRTALVPPTPGEPT
ncbi:SDR family oxidoreductase [Nocardioides sp.]|uniref:SDR family oxidoreductase n=1 Tax=Nocardioides sp. TaxID=35761 RepID=UPI0025CE13F3|nr:SDR family oxidoreductase [Nocardioides sp.]